MKHTGKMPVPLSLNLHRGRDAGLLAAMNSCSKAHRAIAIAPCAHWVWLGCILFFCLAVHADTLEATNLWSFPYGKEVPANVSLSTPAVAPDGTIYAAAFDGKLHALTPDGKEQWHFQAGSEIKSSPAIADDGTIYFGARDRQFYAVTPAGKLKWKFATGGWVDSSPAIAADGTVYFGSWDRNFYALNPDGSLKWKFPVGGLVDSSPAIAADGTIFFGAHNKKFYALDPAGNPRWTFLTQAEITSSPAIGDDGSIYFSSTDGNLYRLTADGKEAWRYRIGGGGNSSPVLAENGNVIIAAANNTFIISPAGALIWKWGSPCWIDETPVATQGTVFFSAPWRKLWGRQPDGAESWEAQVPDNLSSSPVISNQGQIYFACGRAVQAVQPPLALLPAKSSWPMFRANPRHTGRVGSN
jgi:outer membrane protein assembly factor BamB